MSTSLCPIGCGRPSDCVCGVCWHQLRRDLTSVAELAEELTTVACRQTRYSSGGLGVHGGGDEQPLVVDLHAADTARQLRDLLGSWVRELHEVHAIRWQECPDCSARWFSGTKAHDVRMSRLWCSGAWAERVDPLTVDNTAAELAGWMLRHPSWLRSHPAAPELWQDLTAAIGAAWRGVDKPADRAYLGQCTTDLEDGTVCLADVYGRSDRFSVTCRECGAVHRLADRQAALLDASGEQLLTATDVSRAVSGWLTAPLPASTIRSWARRGLLVQHPAHPDDVRQAPRYLVSDVRNLAEQREASRNLTCV